MPYTLSTIRDRVLDDKLDDTTYDPTIVTNFINDTQRDVFNRFELPFQEKIFTGQLTQAGYLFDFPLDYQQAQSLVITDSTGQNKRNITHEYMEFRKFNEAFPAPQYNSPGMPTAWTLYAGQILFNRPTDIPYLLSLFYLKVPKTLSDDADIPEIPEEFSELLVLGAYYRILERNEDFDQGGFIKTTEYSSQVDMLVARYGKRQTGKPQSIGRGYNTGVRSRRTRN